MDIILTHEQADFDALASLLGAYLLDQSRPVLPRKINRNVRSFIARYQSELPFLDMKDLPAGPIHSVCLVDTQSLITLKGMSAKTRVSVYDHHNLRPTLPSNWSAAIFELGACTTYFVENIQSASLELSVIEATLLLLGIYEDTGSLTYTRTTVRDVRAAAYLLECGASLQIAGEYLYPPLSTQQRMLFDELLSNTETLHVHGQEIILARAFAEEMTDEVSSAAHKMRDLLDPDALILMISTSEGVRLVARSTSNQIDVSAIAAHFGGGGHKRAAAALIRLEDEAINKDRSAALNHIYQEIAALLPLYVKPAITVSEIMSSRPSLLSPEQSASEALLLMQRFGYEGFPVVEAGKVVGLLTRRTVDRALSHKMDLRVKSLMETGEVIIHPHQTLEDLHNLMNRSGWGQIPVTDPSSGEVIGIVTRTDLLKTMSNGQTTPPAAQNLSTKLEKALPPAHLALLKRIAAHASERNLALYIVGGFVRDLLLGKSSLDFDIVVEGNAITLAQTLAQEYGGKVVSHKRFGTAKWRIQEVRESIAKKLTSEQKLKAAAFPEYLDLISARTEFYDHPTALPIVERSSIKLDLHRRDFSINTLALRLDGIHYGNLYDYWGGLNDLNHGYIRVLHSLSFVDDPTRLLRAVRFEQRFGFLIEARTQQLMLEAHSLMRQVSGDRIRHELDAIMNEPKALDMLNRLDELALLKAISAHLAWSEKISVSVERLLKQKPEEFWSLPDHVGSLNRRQALVYLGWFYHLPDDHLNAIGKRLRLSSKLMHLVHEIHRMKKELEDPSLQKPSQYTALFQEKSTLSLYIVSCFSSTQTGEAIQQYVEEWQGIHALADGRTLQAYNIPPGPVYRVILEQLRNAWLDKEISTLDEENRLLEKLLQDYRQMPS